MSSKQRDVLLFFDRFNSGSSSLHRKAQAKLTRARPAEFITTGRKRVRRFADFETPVDFQNIATTAGFPSLPSQPILPAHYARLAKGEHFSIFKKDHSEEATSVYNFLLNLEEDKVFNEHVFKFKEDLNEGLFIYAVSVAWLHRKGTARTQLPPPWEINPKSFFSNHVIASARKAASSGTASTDADSKDIHEFVTGTVRDMEFKLSWWREDIGLNGHHVHWHQVYPYNGFHGRIADRQGELFYYMHQQMLARYDAERLAVGLMTVEPFINWHLPIPEGYNPHLTANYGVFQFAARSPNLYLADVWSDADEPLLVSKLEYNYHRLLDAINTGEFVMKKNGSKKDNEQLEVTIDRLGAAVEASIGSPNKALYGSLHNNGHLLLSSVADPDQRYGTPLGVMSQETTAVRDPIFFRWHKFIDNLFVQYKLTLVPYTREQMEIKDLTIKDVKIEVKGGKRNTLTTLMEKRTVDISHDMFLTEESSGVNVVVQQVNHDEFEYNLTIHSQKKMEAVIRIFIAPRCDESNRPYTLSRQRRLYIEMDKFVSSVKAGTNNITRLSTESSVIKLAGLTTKELKAKATQENEDSSRGEAYCKCGWPDHMLLPRGTVGGMKFDLFVMATDWSADKVSGNLNLDRGSSYCGLLDKKYPDKRDMGFPFDRKFDEEFGRNIDIFASKFSNMHVVPISIEYKKAPCCPEFVGLLR